MIARPLRRLALSVSLLLVLALGAPAVHAEAQIAPPDCAALAAWAATIDVEDTYDVAPKLSLPKALSDERLLPVFGASALDWTRDDIGVANRAIKTCGAEARKAGDSARMETLKSAAWLLGKTLARTRGAIDKALANAEKQKAALDAQPDSAELARGIAGLLAIDPAAPDVGAVRGLGRPVSAPLVGLIRNIGHMPPADREALFAALAERRTTILDGLAAGATAAIDDAPADADGVLAIMAAQQTLAAAGASEQLDDVAPKADQRMAEIRASLREAQPPQWVPPACLDLYRWSGAPGAGDVVTLGARATRAAFLDDVVIPVFGVSIGDWGDADFARFATLRTTCKAEWEALLPDGQRIDAVGDEAPELLRLAKAGRWIDSAEGPIENAKTAAVTHRAASAALEAATRKLADLPESVASLDQIAALQDFPELGQADREAREAYAQRIAAKREAIMANALREAEAGLAEIGIASLDDFPAFYRYAQTAAAALPDYRLAARFGQSVEAKASRAALTLRPAFEDALDDLPVSLDGLARAWHATDALTGVQGARKIPPFAGFQTLAIVRARAIADELRMKNCTDYLDELDVDEDDAERLLWDGGNGIPLGQFLCNLATGGGEISEYDGGSTPEIEVTMPLAGLQRIELHEGEVAPGRDMLVGYRIEDANQKRDMSVQEWTLFAAFWVGGGGRIVTEQMCAPVAGKAEDGLNIPERMLALDCTIEALQNER